MNIFSHPAKASLADQPPEVTTEEAGQPGSLPPANAAARRVRAFLMEYGDGLVEIDMGWDLPPLYARDLEALARAVSE